MPCTLGYGIMSLRELFQAWVTSLGMWLVEFELFEINNDCITVGRPVRVGIQSV